MGIKKVLPHLQQKPFILNKYPKTNKMRRVKYNLTDWDQRTAYKWKVISWMTTNLVLLQQQS